jgi:hypothetical protein
MKIQDIQLYTIQAKWNEFDGNLLLFYTVAVGFNPHREWGDDESQWTQEQKDFDEGIFHYYECYEELNQHLKDGDETTEDFIVTKIINK